MFFYINFSVSRLNSILKKCVDIFIEIVLHLLTNLEKNGIFTMLSHPVQEQGMYFYCSSLFLCLSKTVLKFSLYRFVFLAKFIPKYLIFVASKWGFLCHYVFYFVIVLICVDFYMLIFYPDNLLNTFTFGFSFIIDH